MVAEKTAEISLSLSSPVPVMSILISVSIGPSTAHPKVQKVQEAVQEGKKELVQEFVGATTIFAVRGTGLESLGEERRERRGRLGLG